MGRDIDKSVFTEADYKEFDRRLREETRQLLNCFTNQQFAKHKTTCGLELEVWIVDQHNRPNPITDRIINLINSEQVVPELSRFHLEMLTHPYEVNNNFLQVLDNDLAKVWQTCVEAAHSLDADMVVVGSLPTVDANYLCRTYMHPAKRYSALDEQLRKLRHDEPIHVHIEGVDAIDFQTTDIMLVGATASLQTHIQVEPSQAVRYYNAAQILTAPMVAVGANSPYFYGKQLWDESRISIFEQALPPLGHPKDPSHKINRVTIGENYLHDSFMELFLDNVTTYPAVFPVLFKDSDKYSHLRLHNGSIWRWNRPIVGFAEGSDNPHLRIEHRTISAGPSRVDVIANVALFLGLIYSFAHMDVAPEMQLAFKVVKDNFYKAAKNSLQAEVRWLDGQTMLMQDLLLQLLPQAEEGLRQLGIVKEDRDFYLEIIKKRILTGQTGAAWQKKYIAKHGKNFTQLVEAYKGWQQQNLPVHEWKM